MESGNGASGGGVVVIVCRDCDSITVVSAASKLFPTHPPNSHCLILKRESYLKRDCYDDDVRKGIILFSFHPTSVIMDRVVPHLSSKENVRCEEMAKSNRIPNLARHFRKSATNRQFFCGK